MVKRINISGQNPLVDQVQRAPHIGSAETPKRVVSDDCDFERRNRVLSGKQELIHIVEMRSMFLATHFGVDETIARHKPAIARGANKRKSAGALPMKPLGLWA